MPLADCESACSCLELQPLLKITERKTNVHGPPDSAYTGCYTTTVSPCSSQTCGTADLSIRPHVQAGQTLNHRQMLAPESFCNAQPLVLPHHSLAVHPAHGFYRLSVGGLPHPDNKLRPCQLFHHKAKSWNRASKKHELLRVTVKSLEAYADVLEIWLRRA